MLQVGSGKVRSCEDIASELEDDFGAVATGLTPVDIELNLVTNLLESYHAQAGLAGPTSTILENMGVRLPENTDPNPENTDNKFQ